MTVTRSRYFLSTDFNKPTAEGDLIRVAFNNIGVSMIKKLYETVTDINADVKARFCMPGHG